MLATVKCPLCQAWLKLPDTLPVDERLACPKCSSEVALSPRTPTVVPAEGESQRHKRLVDHEAELPPLARPAKAGRAGQGWKLCGCLLLACFGPFAIISCYLVIRHWSRNYSGGAEFTAFLSSVLVGARGLWLLPTWVFSKVVRTMIYLVVMWVLLLVYAVYFNGIVFNEWW
jgi:DNA-directed RNA polymerase subunit RPC12/RpoP